MKRVLDWLTCTTICMKGCAAWTSRALETCDDIVFEIGEIIGDCLVVKEA